MKKHRELKFAIALIIILLSGLPTFSQHVDNNGVDEAKRTEWLEQMISKLRDVKPDTCSAIVQPKITEVDDYYRLSYRFTAPGCIRFENGESVFITLNSSHDNPEIGDVSMAVDNRSRVFVNFGHVCGGIIHFIIEQKIEIHSVDDFFQYTISDTDSKSWKLLEH